ncbi:MAG: class I SAM-dependent methyltransferase [Deltaproteobacteria bacterium]|jgi:SAM-dependent methyltransferase|nr:class I SAM-dependent methyltransferase [Deltaproteobacteria bacterium]
MIPDPELSIWEHSEGLTRLVRRRALDLEPEMDCAAQAAEILAGAGLPPGSRLLDIGCGAGHFIHSLRKRGLALEYSGLDSSPSAIAAGREAYRALSLDPDLLRLGSMEDLAGETVDAALFMNVLSFSPDYRRPLDRAAACGAKVILVRDNFGPETVVSWEEDGYLDPGWNHLKGYWNRWSADEMAGFLGDLGFDGEFIEDRRTGGEMELVVGKPYHWRFLLAKRRPGTADGMAAR